MSVLNEEPATLTEAYKRLLDGTFYHDYDRAGLRLGAVGASLAAMNRFCDRVEAGEVRSRRTYAEFCALIGRAPKA